MNEIEEGMKSEKLVKVKNAKVGKGIDLSKSIPDITLESIEAHTRPMIDILREDESSSVESVTPKAYTSKGTAVPVAI